MLASNIHAYFAHIELDPAVGWEMLETDLENPVADVIDNDHLRSLLARYASMYIDMAWDDDLREEDGPSTFFTNYVVPLLKSLLPLTYEEQRTILGAAGWFGTNTMYGPVRTLLNGHPVYSQKV